MISVSQPQDEGQKEVESTSHAPFPAMLYEVPVIVSATKDQVSFVKANGIGYVLEDYSPNGLKELILSLDITARDSLVQNMKKIKNDICWENQEEKLVSIYNSILI